MPKYDSLRKLERNRLVKDYAEKHPDLSQQEIGMFFNVSASRISRILKKQRENHSEG